MLLWLLLTEYNHRSVNRIYIEIYSKFQERLRQSQRPKPCESQWDKQVECPRTAGSSGPKCIVPVRAEDHDTRKQHEQPAWESAHRQRSLDAWWCSKLGFCYQLRLIVVIVYMKHPYRPWQNSIIIVVRLTHRKFILCLMTLTCILLLRWSLFTSAYSLAWLT